MKHIQEAVAAYLQRETGMHSVCDRSTVRKYPLLAVAVGEDGTILVDGGRQAEHTYSVSVTVVSDRERQDNTALLASLPGILLRGIPMGKRVLHPLNIRTEGEELTFSLTLCVPVPPATGSETNQPGMMAALHMEF